VDNVQQSILFPVSSIIKSDLSEELKALVPKVRTARRLLESLQAAKIETEEGLANVQQRQAELDELLKQIDEKTPDKMKKELAFFGAARLSDDVSVFMKLGTVLFDLYMRLTPEPPSPLGKLIWRKRSMELAELMEKEPLEIPEWGKAAMTKALMDDDIWSNTSLTVWVEVDVDGEPEKGKRYFTINAKGTIYFKKVLEAAAEALYSPELLK
jgi:hypothetical protein